MDKGASGDSSSAQKRYTGPEETLGFVVCASFRSSCLFLLVQQPGHNAPVLNDSSLNKADGIDCSSVDHGIASHTSKSQRADIGQANAEGMMASVQSAGKRDSRDAPQGVNAAVGPSSYYGIESETTPPTQASVLGSNPTFVQGDRAQASFSSKSMHLSYGREALSSASGNLQVPEVSHEMGRSRKTMRAQSASA